MDLTRRFLMTMLMAGVIVLPGSAGTVSWHLGGSGGSTSGFTLTDGTVISGSFTYDADVSTANCSPSCPALPLAGTDPAADWNGTFGLFGNPTTGGATGSITVASGSLVPPSLNWFINTNISDPASAFPTDCCSDSTDLWLVSANPTTTNDLTGAYGIQLFLTDPMTDSGNLVPTGDIITSALFGVCSDFACGNVFIDTNPSHATASLADSAANVNTGDAVAGTPEPSTFLLGVSAILIGSFRKKIFRAK